MGNDYVELVLQGYESWNAGDRAWVLEHMTPEVRWTTPPDDPDQGTFVGYHGIQQFWNSWSELLGRLRFEPIEAESHGDQVLMVCTRIGRGNVSGVEIRERVIQVFSFDSQGKCHSVEEFYDRRDADAALADIPSHTQGERE